MRTISHVPSSYRGPLRDEPLAIELHNTIYASGGTGVDALKDPEQAGTWLSEVLARDAFAGLPTDRAPEVPALVRLRTAIRSLVRSATQDEPFDPGALDLVNATCSSAPVAPRIAVGADGVPVRAAVFGGARPEQVVLAAFAADAVELLTGEHRDALRVCGAPGCVLAFVRTHPRRAWCSNGCGNRARQARHYRRTRADADAGTRSGATRSEDPAPPRASTPSAPTG